MNVIYRFCSRIDKDCSRAEVIRYLHNTFGCYGNNANEMYEVLKVYQNIMPCVTSYELLPEYKHMLDKETFVTIVKATSYEELTKKLAYYNAEQYLLTDIFIYEHGHPEPIILDKVSIWLVPVSYVYLYDEAQAYYRGLFIDKMLIDLK